MSGQSLATALAQVSQSRSPAVSSAVSLISIQVSFQTYSGCWWNSFLWPWGLRSLPSMAPGSGLSEGHSRHGCGLSPHDKSSRKALLSKGSPEEAGPMQDHLFDELKVSLLGAVMVSATTLYHGPAHGCRRSLGPALSL